MKISSASLRRSFQWLIITKRNLSQCNQFSLPLSSLWGSFWKESFHSLCSFPTSTGIVLRSKRFWDFSSRAEIHNCFSLPSYGMFFSFWSLWPFFGLFPNTLCVFWIVGTQYSSCDLTSAERDDYISVSSSSAPADAIQDLIGLCCFSGALLIHDDHVVHQDNTHTLPCTEQFGFGQHF